MSAHCQLCEVKDINKNAFVWCMSCKIPLCSSCHKCHIIKKVTNDHIIMGIKEYSVISGFLSKIQTKCEHHPKLDLEYSCSVHKTVFCVSCKRKKHENCKNIRKIKDKNKKGQIYSTLELLCKQLNENISALTTLCNDRQSDIQKLKSQHIDLLCDIQKKRKTINLALDIMETGLRAKFEKGYQIAKRKIDEDHKIYVETKTALQSEYEQLNTIIKIRPLSIIQAFIAEKHIREQNKRNKAQIKKFVGKSRASTFHCRNSINVSKSDRSIQISDHLDISIVQSRCYDSLNTEIQEQTEDKDNDNIITNSSTCEDELDSILSEWTDNLSENSADEHSNPLKPQLEKNSISETYKTQRRRSHKFNCTKRFIITNEGCQATIKCVKLLTNGRVVFGDCSNSWLLIFDITGCSLGKIKLQFAPRSIAVVDYNKIAVTTGKYVVIANVETFEIEKIFSQNDDCYGITVIRNQLVVDCEKKGLKFLDINGLQTRYYGGLNRVLHMTTISLSTIVYVERGSDLVNFLNIDTNERKCYHCLNLSITGITTDAEDNVYVSCDQTNVICILQWDLGKCRSILTSNDGIDRPLDIDFQNGVLYAINNNGKSVYSYQRV